MNENPYILYFSGDKVGDQRKLKIFTSLQIAAGTHSAFYSIFVLHDLKSIEIEYMYVVAV